MERVTKNGSPPASDALFTPSEWAALVSELRLSPRERQILEAMCDGLKDQAVAQQLGFSVYTVRSHICRLHRKIDVPNRAALLVGVFKTHRRLERDFGGDRQTVVIEVVDCRMLTHVCS